MFNWNQFLKLLNLTINYLKKQSIFPERKLLLNPLFKNTTNKMISNTFKIQFIKEIQLLEKSLFQFLPTINNQLLDKYLYQLIILILLLSEKLLPLKYLREKEVIGTEEKKKEKLIGRDIILRPVGFKKDSIKLIKIKKKMLIKMP